MGKFFIDTEFLDGPQDNTFCGIKYGETKPTIDLISLGMVNEHGSEYYAISKEFNLKEAWGRFDQRTGQGDRNNIESKIYWIRDNVLFPIFNELKQKEKDAYHKTVANNGRYIKFIDAPFTYGNLKYLINKYGKTNKEIAFEVFRFVHAHVYEKWDDRISFIEEIVESAYEQGEPKHEFYAYYGAYDWVVFCWLWGKMINLQTGFPMYVRDLKQMLDEKLNNFQMYEGRDCWGNDPERFLKGDLQEGDRLATLEEKLKGIKQNHPLYPKQDNAHNSLDDARWNLNLYKFIRNTL